MKDIKIYTTVKYKDYNFIMQLDNSVKLRIDLVVFNDEHITMTIVTNEKVLQLLKENIKNFKYEKSLF